MHPAHALRWLHQRLADLGVAPPASPTAPSALAHPENLCLYAAAVFNCPLPPPGTSRATTHARMCALVSFLDEHTPLPPADVSLLRVCDGDVRDVCALASHLALATVALSAGSVDAARAQAVRWLAVRSSTIDARASSWPSLSDGRAIAAALRFYDASAFPDATSSDGFFEAAHALCGAPRMFEAAADIDGDPDAALVYVFELMARLPAGGEPAPSSATPAQRVAAVSGEPSHLVVTLVRGRDLVAAGATTAAPSALAVYASGTTGSALQRLRLVPDDQHTNHPLWMQHLVFELDGPRGGAGCPPGRLRVLVFDAAAPSATTAPLGAVDVDLGTLPLAPSTVVFRERWHKLAPFTANDAAVLRADTAAGKSTAQRVVSDAYSLVGKSFASKSVDTDDVPYDAPHAAAGRVLLSAAVVQFSAIATLLEARGDGAVFGGGVPRYVRSPFERERAGAVAKAITTIGAAIDVAAPLLSDEAMDRADTNTDANEQHEDSATSALGTVSSTAAQCLGELARRCQAEALARRTSEAASHDARAAADRAAGEAADARAAAAMQGSRAAALERELEKRIVQEPTPPPGGSAEIARLLRQAREANQREAESVSAQRTVERRLTAAEEAVAQGRGREQAANDALNTALARCAASERNADAAQRAAEFHTVETRRLHGRVDGLVHALADAAAAGEAAQADAADTAMRRSVRSPSPGHDYAAELEHYAEETATLMEKEKTATAVQRARANAATAKCAELRAELECLSELHTQGGGADGDASAAAGTTTGDAGRAADAFALRYNNTNNGGGTSAGAGAVSSAAVSALRRENRALRRRLQTGSGDHGGDEADTTATAIDRGMREIKVLCVSFAPDALAAIARMAGQCVGRRACATASKIAIHGLAAIARGILADAPPLDGEHWGMSSALVQEASQAQRNETVRHLRALSIVYELCDSDLRTCLVNGGDPLPSGDGSDIFCGGLARNLESLVEMARGAGGPPRKKAGSSSDAKAGLSYNRRATAGPKDTGAAHKLVAESRARRAERQRKIGA